MHCRGLRELLTEPENSDVCSFASLAQTDPLPGRVADVMSLTQLTGLQWLGLKPNCDTEVAALVAAAGCLMRHSLRAVGLWLEYRSDVVPLSLLSLGVLMQLT